MRNKLCFLAILLMGTLNVFAQSTVKGKLIDSLNDEAIPYANVSLLDTNEEIVKHTGSDFEGNFSLTKVPKGVYQLRISFVGYQEIQKSITVKAGENLLLGEVKMNQDSKQLAEVTVEAMQETVSTKIDRKVYAADDFEIARNGSATDMLNKLPSISVSPEGEVSVRGTSGFMVYINGKPTQIDPSVLLAQISANSIQNIEVITVPSAKYDAQGKAGIINITIDKKAMEGTSVNAVGMIGGSPWREGADPMRGSGNFSISHQKDKWSFNIGANYANTTVDGRRVGEAEVHQFDGLYKGGTYHMDADGDRPEWHENYSLNIGVGYEFNENTSLDASYFYGFKSEKRTANYVYHNYYTDENAQLIQGTEEYIYNPNTHDRFGTFQTANLNFNHKFDSESKLNVSMVYEHSFLEDDLDNKNQTYDKEAKEIGEITTHYTQLTENPLDSYRFSVDYETGLSDNQALGFGFQPQFLDQSGIYHYDTLNTTTGNWNQHPYSNDYELTQAIYAAYIDYGIEWNKLKIKAGIRAEYMDQQMTVGNTEVFPIVDIPVKEEYSVKRLDWFPSLSLDYALTEIDRLIFGASRRIDRPKTKNMAPFLYRRHYEVYEVGDPTLEPEYVNLAEITYNKSIGDQTIGITAFYRGVENAVFRVNTINPGDNVLMRSYTNAGDDQSFGLELNTNLNIANKVKWFVGGSLYHYSIEGVIYDYIVDQSSLNWTLKSTVNSPITNEFSVSWDIDVQSATVTAQGGNDLFYISNIALLYQPEKLKEWTFTLKCQDLFASNVKGLDSTGQNKITGEDAFYQETTYYRYGPVLELGVSYAINSKPKQSKKKTAFDKQF